MSESTTLWTKQGEVYTSSLKAIQAAGGQRKVVLQDSTLRVADVQWTVETQKDGSAALVKVIPRVPSRRFVIRIA